MSDATAPAPRDSNIPPRADIAKIRGQQGEDIEILCGSPLPDYDSGPVKAYLARSAGRGQGEYFALVCEKHAMPRVFAISAYKNFSNAMMVPFVTSGVGFWPPAKEERYIFIYKNVLGKRIHKPGTAEALGWRQETVMEAIVRPMAQLLREFSDAGFVHGAIRPSNMFTDSVAGKSSQVVLGDCLSLPASYLQPVMYEPIERSMAQPSGRGEGVLQSDLYSWGVTLAVFLRSHDPMHGMSDDEIIKEKLEFGSYAAITGKDRFKGSILELLRGLLHDDQKERWTIEEVMTWLDGRRLSPKQSQKLKKAARPLTFDNNKYSYASLLAMDLERNLPDILRLVDGGDMDQWLERSLEDEEVTERVVTQIKASKDKGTGPGYEERLASNLSVALDPMAPVRYKGLRLMGDGIGCAIVEAFARKSDLQPFVDLFTQGFAFTWLTSSKNLLLDTGALIARFDQCRNYIRHGKPGYGLERCIYTLSAECPCLSEKIKAYYVQSPEELIVAYEDLCRKGNAPAMFLDRHSMAFLSAKEPKVIDPYLMDLSSSEDHRRVMGNLKCLASIQKRFGMGHFPGIAKVFIEALPSVYARFHDREARAKLESAVKKFAAEGDLVKMEAVLGNTEVTQQDNISFRKAMIEYSELTKEYNNLLLRLDDKGVFGKSTGKEFAAIVSCGIAAIIILALGLMFLSKNGAL